MKDYPRLPLGSLVKIVRGISYKSSELADGEVGVPMVNLRNVGKGGGFRTDGLKRYTGEYKPSQVLEPGDLILANTDLSKAKDVLGSTFLIPQTLSGAVLSLDLSKLVPDESVISKRFLNYFLHSPEARSFMKEHGQGITVMHLRMSALPSLQVPVPPLEEQKRIVETLDDHLSRLDKALAELESAERKVISFRQSTLNTFTVESEESGSGSWQDLSLGELGKWVTGSTPSSSDPANQGDDVPFVTPGDIGLGGKLGSVARRISSLGADRVRRIKPGSVILVCIGTIGKVAWTDMEITTNQQINVLEVDQSRHDIRFVHWVLASPRLQAMLWANSTSVTVALLNKKRLESLSVRLPNLETQRVLVELIEANLAMASHLATEISRQKVGLQTLRRTLLHSAFSGQLGK